MDQKHHQASPTANPCILYWHRKPKTISASLITKKIVPRIKKAFTKKPILLSSILRVIKSTAHLSANILRALNDHIVKHLSHRVLLNVTLVGLPVRRSAESIAVWLYRITPNLASIRIYPRCGCSAVVIGSLINNSVIARSYWLKEVRIDFDGIALSGNQGRYC